MRAKLLFFFLLISSFTDFSAWQTRAVFDKAVLVSTSRLGKNMSQARVTDFFAQRKKGIAGPVKPAKQRSSAVVGYGSTAITVADTRSRSSKNLCSSSVHEEFVNVIDEAVGLQEEEVVKDIPSCPRTPKRTSATEFDLGAGVFSATADHSTAKKRRQVEAVSAKANVPEKPQRRRARKKLVLPQDTPHAGVQARPSEMTQQAAAPTSPVSEHKTSSSPLRGQLTGKITEGQAPSKVDIAALKSRLQRIKKREEELVSTEASPSVYTLSSPADAAPRNPPHHVPKTAIATTSKAEALKRTVARAKELATKAQRRNEEREAEESKSSETQAQDSTEQPAYQRYHTLAQAAPPGLSLPYHYKVLAEMFRSMDTVVAMLYNRCETATFAKIKQGVQDMMHKRFEESHIGQIKTVFPEAYTFRQEKNIPTFNSSIKKGSYQLTVEPVILSDQNEARLVLSASHLVERRRTFHLKLVCIVKRHHKVFLSSLVPPMSVPEEKLTRWHPGFNVDTVPAIQTSSLPQPPHTEKLSTAQEVLDKARSLITPKMEKALVSLVLTTEDKVADSKAQTSPQDLTVPQKSAAVVPAALKGVSQSLLDRIRAKEAQKLQAAMIRNPTQEDRLLMMSRLPELARILRNVFVAEKKPALIMEVVCNRMVASYRSALCTGEMEKHIRLLAEVAADWLSIHPIRKDFYLKLNKNTELSIVMDKLNSRLREEERI
ncbi:DNA replication factor Cdt1 [Acanthopagrus latus]|uniref:DNA replication factor Cdt1 n=1 Tax=Acanthopagrus latus TaxID=8177 RepID=UPI00187C30B6|nr:DNA replication factor Cdt1 [Acanthopagrus latus]